MSFTDLGLSPNILSAIEKKGYSQPSPIQAQAIPAVLSGRDVMAAAQTGTGKTAGFTLPILHLLEQGKPAKPNQARALILTPTRELAAQIADNVQAYGSNLALKSAVVFGGVGINPQMQKLRKGADILVATPGRLLDLFSQNAVKFDSLEVLVLDEADRMLDMGFIHDIKRVLKLLPQKRQNLMFSATFSDDIRQLAKGMINDPIEVSVTPPNSTVDLVEQWVYPVDKSKKTALLTRLVKDNNWHQVLVFSRTKHGANRIAKQLTARGIESAAIHGNKSQGARTKALADFKQGKVQALIATDIAARGLDIDQLPQVVNYDLPHVAEDYVHRIGRTGRAGATGHAISLVTAEEFKQLRAIERLTKQVLQRETVSGFEPQDALPESTLDTRPIKPKKPKKAKANDSDQRNSSEKTQHSKRRNSRRPNNRGNSQRQNTGNQRQGSSGNNAKS